MRLWHISMIAHLPSQQLVGQWREIHAVKGAIDKNGTPNHPLVNKVLDYPIKDFKEYSLIVYNAMVSRGYGPNQNKLLDILNWESDKFAPSPEPTTYPEFISNQTPFHDWHNDRYFIQCFCNLQEKYDCGMIPHKEWVEFLKVFHSKGGELNEVAV